MDDGNRLMRVFVSLLVVAGVLYGFYRLGTATRVYKGDVKEERICRLCDGAGQTCKTCGGKGKVKVIVPGPNRPMDVYIDVYDQKIRAPGKITWIPVPGQTALGSSLPGAIQKAEVILTDSAGKEVFREVTKLSGQVIAELKPGLYKVAVRKSGYRDYECDLEVPVQTAPIWLEKAKLPKDYYDPNTGERNLIGGEMQIGVGMTGI